MLTLFRNAWVGRGAALGWLIFIFSLAGLGVGKYLQNRAQIAYVADRPAREQAQWDEHMKARQHYWSVFGGLLGRGSAQEVRQRLDPTGEIARGGGWVSRPPGQQTGREKMHDPVTGRTIELDFVEDRLVNAWIDPLPVSDDPVRFWAAAEGIRKTAGIIAALFWLVAVVGAYREPLLRKKMAQLALAGALTALVCWWLEPPEGIRDRGLRVPYGSWVGLGLVILTLPAFLILLRKGNQAGKCRHCGYNLWGNQSGVCPECGNATPGELLRRRKAKSAEFARALEQGEGSPEHSGL